MYSDSIQPETSGDRDDWGTVEMVSLHGTKAS